MAKVKAISGEIILPDAVIQHIQSFLSGEEAARTMIISKSWYRAWSTHPNLDFDERNFRTTLAFFMFTKKTVDRYQKLNLKIESLRLWMRDACHEKREVGKHSSFVVANELIVKAVEMGVTDLNITVNPESCSFVLPHEVLESESLIRLSLSGCTLHRGKVSCSRLKSLILRRVCIVGHLIWDLHWSCPLIEKLSFSECNLELHDPYRTMHRMLPLGPFTEFGEQYVGSVLDGIISPRYEFHKLESLFLEKLDFDTSIFHDLSSKFPCLKDLAFHNCFGFKSIQISSHSLECISISEMKLRWAKFDVPNIRKFAFSGWNFPCLCFTAASRELESDISITYNRRTTSWFGKLKKFLKRLSMSKISLTLKFLERSIHAGDVQYFPQITDIRDVQFLPQPTDTGDVQFLPQPTDAGDAQLLPKPAVENMMLSMDEPSLELLDGLFCSCRPKFITHCSTLMGEANNGLLKLLWETLVQERSENDYIPNRSRLGLHDLEEVNVEVFEESLVEWRPLPWKTLLDASANPANKQKVRFHLRWGVGG